MDSVPSSRENDVLYAKGGAAQTITNPGNLRFYQLCEQRYDEFQSLDSADPKRRVICTEIVDAITAGGGVFRTATGGVMKRELAINKTRDRMRQISKPKIRPTGFNVDDVVFCKGGKNFLYPGNSKWRTLLDGYVLSYFREVVANGMKNGRLPGFAARRPSYQREIVDETIRIIHSRGGRFLDEGLQELSHEGAAEKTHCRFKDLKKELIAGTRTFLPQSAVEKKKEAEASSAVAAKCDDKDVKPGTEILLNRSGGFTSAKTLVTSASELKALEKKRRTEERKSRKGKKKAAKSIWGRGRQKDEEDDDSFESAKLDSDNDAESSSDDDDCEDSNLEDMATKRINKRQQKEARKERAKRRKSGIAAAPQQPQKKKRRRPKVEERSRSPSPEHPLSQYELQRLEKIKRNQSKLAELGLLTAEEKKAQVVQI